MTTTPALDPAGVLDAAFDRLDRTNLRTTGVATGATGLVVRLLADAYTQPELAVVRELVTNGIDAHRRSGTDAAVRLTLPTDESPRLIVEDFGIGMSRFELEHNFTDVGASTKTGDPLSIGNFGVGAKCPYAVTDRYAVRTTRDGVTTVAAFTVDAAGHPASAVASEEYTGEPGGTQVVIELENPGHAWSEAASDLLRHLPIGSLEVIGHTDNRYYAGRHWTKLIDPVLSNDEVVVLRTIGHNDDYQPRTHQIQYPVVMDGVGYALPRGIAQEYPDRIFLVQPKGLELTHTRETIKDTPANREILHAMSQRWRKQIIEPLEAPIISATTRLARHLAFKEVQAKHLRWLPSRNLWNQSELSRPLITEDTGTDGRAVTILAYSAWVYAPGQKRQEAQPQITMFIRHLEQPDTMIFVDLGELDDPSRELADAVSRSYQSRISAAVRTLRQNNDDDGGEGDDDDYRPCIVVSSPARIRAAMDYEHEHHRRDQAFLPALAEGDITWTPLAEFLAQNPAAPKNPRRGESRARTLLRRSPSGQWEPSATVAEAERLTYDQVRQELTAGSGRVVLCTGAQIEHWDALLKAISGQRNQNSLWSEIGNMVLLHQPRQPIAALIRELGTDDIVGLDEHMHQKITAHIDRFTPQVYAIVASVHEFSLQELADRQVRERLIRLMPRGKERTLLRERLDEIAGYPGQPVINALRQTARPACTGDNIRRRYLPLRHEAESGEKSRLLREFPMLAQLLNGSRYGHDVHALDCYSDELLRSVLALDAKIVRERGAIG